MGMNHLDEEKMVLFLGEKELEPASVERNMVGFCSLCNAEMESIAYHLCEQNWLVSARCSGEHLVLMRYDLDWNWLGDEDLEISTGAESISALPREKLEAIFTPAEIRDMLAYERGEPYTRQNLYRARAKLERFERLFGIKIKVK
jgi:hypothetical protein